MTDERWQSIVGQLKETYAISAEGKEDLDDRPGTCAFFCFVGPGEQKMRLERLTYAPVIGKRTSGGSRVGAAARVEYEYDEEKMIDRLALKRWNAVANDWDEVKAGAEALF